MPEPSAPEAVTAERAPRRRQARGERRAQQLLDAAAEVFGRAGYAASSTNAIAREAGVSPGTLYQFFPNKEALAIELGRRYNHEIQEKHSASFTPDNAMLPLAAMLDTLLDPMIEFCLENPAFTELLQSADSPGVVAEEHGAVDESLLTLAQGMLALRAPGLATEDAERVAAMAFAVFKAGLDLISASEGAARRGYITQLKNVLHGYLAPVVGTGPVTPPA